MNQDNRVLNRVGARDLTQDESNRVTGGIRTLTTCTIVTAKGVSGDEGPLSPEHC